MRILLVDAANEWRGGQSQFFYTARGLLARGHDTCIACRRGGVLERRASEAGLAVRALPFRGDLSLLAILGLARLIRRWRPDVLQLNDPHAVACGFVAARVAGLGLKRPPLVATRRVDFHLRGTPSRVKYSACDRVIAVSRAIQGILIQDGVAPAQLRLVYEGVPDRAPQPGGREALAAIGVPDGSPVVGIVAALTSHKDHATFLDAAAQVLRRLSRTRFVLVGDGELRADLEAQAARLGISQSCHFAGFRSDVDVLVPAFTLFCLSSRWEGLGTSLLDAMCFSRPIVATAAGGIPEAVEDGVSGRVVPVASPQPLAEAVVELLSDDARREALGRAGRLRFQSRFTDQRMVEDTLAVYREVG